MLEDRGYMRSRRPAGVAGWLDGVSAVAMIMTVTIGVYVLQLLTGNFGADGGWIPGAMKAFPVGQPAEWALWPLRLITYQFLHHSGDALHLIFNMLVFFFVGRLVEQVVGRKYLLLLYFPAGIVAGLV